ncbi:hypothetical protein K470DRAFT_258436 [Piedraia hortae CBS 480.64]|uniref:RNA polymerase II degradation factor 1 n=1 Tax=Piedraia hortae CBS 480.64 TaxID=1314780 RepID=A0A6A7BXU0_9PEZI|nr:hypothetical protein K470DRAFT_258436 [Piedraia hortae CBS 480.64]
MSEGDVRPRGRSTARGGRGGHGRGGPRGSRRTTNGSREATSLEAPVEEEGEIGEMKRKYHNDLPILKDMFPDWTDDDLVFALQECHGDLSDTVDKITRGNVSQFAEVKKPKDRARSKAKEEPAADKPGRGGRGRGGYDSARGERGRGSGRGRGRGGHSSSYDTPADDSSTWETSNSAWDTSAGGGGWDNSAATGGWKNSATNAASGGGDNSASGWDKPKAETGESSTIGWDAKPAASSGGWNAAPAATSGAWDAKPAATTTAAWDSKPEAPASGGWDSKPAEASSGWDSAPAETSSSGDSKPTAAAAGRWDSQPTSSGWGAPNTAPDTGSGWGNVAPAKPAEPAKSSLIPQDGPKKTWASLVSQSKPKSGLVRPAVPNIGLASKEHAAQAPTTPSAMQNESHAETTSGELKVPGPKAPLTEENVEHLPDASHPPMTHTAASTTGSVDPRNLTPLPSAHPPIGSRPTMGYAATAQRAASGLGRSASYHRKIQEQQEAVVLPGHNAVDRAAVQFGSMGLGSDSGPDVDEDREEPETQKILQHSPPSQPRTSLPPMPRRQEVAAPEMQQHKQGAGFMSPQTHQTQQPAESENHQETPSYDQYGRNAQPGAHQPQQQRYDAFGSQPGGYDQYAPQGPQQGPHQNQTGGFGAMSSGPMEYPMQYASSEGQRNAYPQYHGGAAGYGPQDARAQQHQDVHVLGQQRSASGLGGHVDSGFAGQAHPVSTKNSAAHPGLQSAQSRFGDNQGSGQNTPNPLMGANAQPHSMHQGPAHHHHQPPAGYGAGAGAFPYGHAYYPSPFQQAYQNQFTGYNNAYNAGLAGKQGGMYGGPPGYIGSHSSFDQHSGSPANAGAFGQNSMRSASGMGSGVGGLDEYGRGSGPTSQGGFDAYGRSASGFGGQQYGPQAMSGPDESLKHLDSKNSASPALGQPGRPDSAANSAAGTPGGLPPSQSQHSGLGGAGYPGFPGQGGQYGALGGLGGHQQGPAYPYPYAHYSYPRGGWGNNYNGH